jgi:hypothetical protein
VSTIWGVAGWASCEQRIAFLVATLRGAVDRKETPKYWRFTAQGWGELSCCWPSVVLERRRIVRRDADANELRLLGLPYFIEPDAPHPFALECSSEWDDAEIARLHSWRQDQQMRAIAEAQGNLAKRGTSA